MPNVYCSVTIRYCLMFRTSRPLLFIIRSDHYENTCRIRPDLRYRELSIRTVVHSEILSSLLYISLSSSQTGYWKAILTSFETFPEQINSPAPQNRIIKLLWLVLRILYHAGTCLHKEFTYSLQHHIWRFLKFEIY